MLIDAIIVNWNGGRLLEECVAALRRQTLRPARLFVVDNGSSDGSVDWLRLQPDVTLIDNQTNEGFAAANNAALARSTADVVLLVNADALLEPRYIELTSRCLDDPSVGSVTGKLIRAGAARTIDSTGHNVYGLGWAENRGEELPDAGFDEPGEVFGVCAAAALYRRAALDSAAVAGEYLDESFFSYIEDVDLDWRLRWMGWRAWYEPRALAVHHRSATGARFSAAIMRHILKNRLLTVAKNYDNVMLLRHGLGVLLFTATKGVDFARVHPSALLGIGDALRLWPAARRKRAELFAKRRAGRVQMERWLRPFPLRQRLVRRALRGVARA